MYCFEEQRPVVEEAPAQSHGPTIRQASGRSLKQVVINHGLFGASGRSRRMNREHWRPLRLRIVKDNLDGLNKVLDDLAVGQRETVRELKTNDTNIRIPPDIGKWLVDNVATDPDGDPPPQLLYAAKISQRFKDRIITQTPLGVGCACPFPFAYLQYAYTYYRFYTTCAIPRALRVCDQPMLYHARQYDKRTYLYLYDNRCALRPAAPPQRRAVARPYRAWVRRRCRGAHMRY
jgi:hypothetical protein